MSRRRASNSDSLASSSVNEAQAYPFSGMQNSSSYSQRRGPIEGPGGRRLVRRVTWRSSTYKLMASLWVLGVLYIVWLIRDIFYLPFSYSSKPAITPNAGDDLLAQYVGREDCGISSQALYLPPRSGDELYCQSRESLLSSMSNGGRHGFGAPYTSQDCFYRWYTNSEICEILGRFDGIFFIGDDSLADGYAGFNILLRQDLKQGSLKEWEMGSNLGMNCRCNSQLTNSVCSSARITSSEELYSEEGNEKTQNPYTCSNYTPHTFLPISGSPAPSSAHNRFKSLLARSSEEKKPVAVIQSLSMATSYSLETATKSIDEWLTLAKTSARSTPFLWIGPTAPGHQKPPGDNVHAITWQYTKDTAQAAQSRGIDVLGMYNATLQAESWNGVRYGEDVALMQAMMIINWLASL